jgi:hypothetical protein
MSILAPLAVLVVIAGLLWRARQTDRLDRLRLVPPQRPFELPPRSADSDEQPTEKHVGGQLGFLRDLKHREREVANRARHPQQRSAGRDPVIEAEFREVKTEHDRPA